MVDGATIARWILAALACSCGRLGFDRLEGGGSAVAGDGAIDTTPDTTPDDGPVCSSDKLVGHWKFDETAGTTARDSTPNGNNGLLMNMNPATDWVAGRIGNGLDFDGVDDRVVVPAAPALADLGPATWAFWIRLRTIDATIAYKSDDNGSEGWWLDVEAAEGGLGIAAVYGGSNHRRYTGMFALGTWSHVAITWDRTPTGALIYVDGLPAIVDGTDSAGSGTHNSDATRDLFIGGGGGGSNYNFDGTLDELRIYNGVLSPSQIAQLTACQ